MFGLGQLTGIGGVAVGGFIVCTIALCVWIGMSLGEALYLSTLGLVAVGYGVTEWRMRQEQHGE